jgi:hypothetical protein
MKAALFLSLLIMAAAMAVPLGSSRLAEVPSHGQETDADITVTIVNSFQAPYASEVLDLGWMPSGYLLFTSIQDLKVYACDPSTGAYVDALDTYDDTNPAPYGVAYGPTGGVLTTNDYTIGSLFTWTGAAWSETPNPADVYGRGIEYDQASNAFWEAVSTPTGRYLYRFVPGGSSAFYALQNPPSILTGVALFPLGSGLGVVVSGYSDLHLYFYQYVGTSLTYVGSAPLPVTPYPDQFSLGLTYASQRGTFFWSYIDNIGTTICELDIEVDLGLEPATWGSIKTLF